MKFDISLSELKKGILDAFFRAILAGYASSHPVEKIRIPEIPGKKMTICNPGRFTVIDSWTSVPGNQYSFGETIVCYDGIPVWMMSYQGWYKEEAIPTLKQALLTAYGAQIFNGGRGPSTFEWDGYTYHNEVTQNNWDDFRGCEEIVDSMGQILGIHRYQGMFLGVINL